MEMKARHSTGCPADNLILSFYSLLFFK